MPTTPTEGRSGFGTFLDYMQARGIGFKEPATGGLRRPGDDVAERVLAALRDASASEDVASLLVASGLPSLSHLLQVLDTLLEHGLIVRKGNDDGERFALSTAGNRTAAAILMARAAGVK